MNLNFYLPHRHLDEKFFSCSGIMLDNAYIYTFPWFWPAFIFGFEKNMRNQRE